MNICTREICAACQKISPVNFSVPNDIWKIVVHPSLQNDILCLMCFILRADEKLIEWDKDIQLFPISLATIIKIRNEEV